MSLFEFNVSDPAVETSFSHKLGSAIFAIRWGLVPMYMLMWIPIVGYCLWFAQEVVSFWIEFDVRWAPGLVLHAHILLHNRESFILWGLGLIDASMVANLIVLVTMGGYKNFVYDIDFSSFKGIPKWYAHLDSNSLKIKMALSLLGVTAVAILRMAMEYNREFAELIAQHHGDAVVLTRLMTTNVILQLTIHIVFIITALGFTWNARLMHPSPPTPDHA